jgi:branched-chain amino acid transport system ATP-binding protein
MLKLDRIEVFYGKLQALFGLSLEVDQGQLVALIGANGAGKTTTLRAISGLMSPASGKIEFMGKPIHGLGADQIVALGIGHCPEQRRLWPDMTVWENLVMGAFRRKDKGEVEGDIRQMYDLFPVIAERKDQKAGSLSGGEQQMLAIARSLMGRPKLVMFDEPSLGLAPKVVEQTAEVIRRINQQGTTVLLVEQNALMALGMAHKAYVLETGRVVLEGTGEELLQDDHVRRAYLGA